jgi:arginine decarboxylase
LKDLTRKLAADPSILPQAPAMPGISTLSVEMVMAGPDAMSGPAKMVRYEDAAGQIAAEMIAPAPPGVPRLVPGQRITSAHVSWLVAQRDAGAFVMDPIDPTEATVRVVEEGSGSVVR